jgi:hypothetical protein
MRFCQNSPRANARRRASIGGFALAVIDPGPVAKPSIGGTGEEVCHGFAVAATRFCQHRRSSMMEDHGPEFDWEQRRLLAKFEELGYPPPAGAPSLAVLRHILFYLWRLRRMEREIREIRQAEYDAAAVRH